MAEQELEMEDGTKRKKILIIAAVLVVLVGGGVAAYFFFSGEDDNLSSPAQVGGVADQTASDDMQNSITNAGSALYVAMPRPFVFNVPGSGRDRLVQIKAQLMVRGNENENMAKTHIPMIEGTLLSVFSTANADDLVTEAGKVALRDMATREVQTKLQNSLGRPVVDQVLFTGFVMQ